MKRILWLTVIAQFSFILCASAQSVADAARKERARQQEVHSVVTISGTTPSPAGVTADTAAGTGGTEAATGATKTAAAAASGPADKNGHDEKYWRAAFQKARDDVKRASEKSQLLDLKIKDLNKQLLTQSDMYNRENRLGVTIADTQKQLDDASKESAQAKQKITDLEEELRKSGGPAGWAR